MVLLPFNINLGVRWRLSLATSTHIVKTEYQLTTSARVLVSTRRARLTTRGALHTTRNRYISSPKKLLVTCRHKNSQGCRHRSLEIVKANWSMTLKLTTHKRRIWSNGSHQLILRLTYLMIIHSKRIVRPTSNSRRQAKILWDLERTTQIELIFSLNG